MVGKCIKDIQINKPLLKTKKKKKKKKLHYRAGCDLCFRLYQVLAPE